ncbi:DUF445 domain-containing protein [Anaeromicropila herbilytica]|uniref:UPF0754 membrane protein n=1 Tax=Anaeromicropila herbilytica TaxID=2785025 RepID=A0A7R7IEH9_9FIRM|nr:DUF445 family protein [Anaeromicropila herbilytica]BCN32119.1 UPF0754 membrane protein [Anaeromicropila herbilytica]
MNILEMISGPVIGAIIGYGTNYIAVKMLFRPLRPIKIGKYTLPFTPGIIPKRKDKLGHALGEMVGNNLLTKEDIENILLSSQMKNAVLDDILKRDQESKRKVSIENIISDYSNDEQAASGITKLKDNICEKLIDGANKIDIGTVIATEVGKAIKQKVQGTMIGFMVNDQLISSFQGPIAENINEYIEQNGQDIFMPIISDEIDELVSKSPEEVLSDLGFEENQLRNVIEVIYTKFIAEKAESIIKQFDIARIVEKKVDDMDVLEIEKLVLSVMEHELNAVVNLGAVIGLILGLFNLLF